MIKCPSCSNINSERNVFCLNCGSLLKDYSSIEISKINYNLPQNEFILQLINQIEAEKTYYDVFLNPVSDMFKNISERCGSSQTQFELGTITVKQHEKNVSDEFFRLVSVCETYLNSVNKSLLRILKLFDVLCTFVNTNNLSKTNYEKLTDELINSLNKFVGSLGNLKKSVEGVNLDNPGLKLKQNQQNSISVLDKMMIFHSAYSLELEKIKYHGTDSKKINFCMNCGHKLEVDIKFCPNCGVKVGQVKEDENKTKFEEYESQVNALKIEYTEKEKRVKELIEKSFDSTQITYDHFMDIVDNNTRVFNQQADIILEIINVAIESPSIDEGINEKINLLKSIIDKTDDLINELVIHLSSNGENESDVKNLSEEMRKLIDSVKYY